MGGHFKNSTLAFYGNSHLINLILKAVSSAAIKEFPITLLIQN